MVRMPERLSGIARADNLPARHAVLLRMNVAF
jgi:hypothetical protein